MALVVARQNGAAPNEGRSVVVNNAAGCAVANGAVATAIVVVAGDLLTRVALHSVDKECRPQGNAVSTTFAAEASCGCSKHQRFLEKRLQTAW